MVRKTIRKGVYWEFKTTGVNIYIICDSTRVFLIRVGNLTVLKRLKEARRDSKSCFLELSSRWFILKSPHITMMHGPINIRFTT